MHEILKPDELERLKVMSRPNQPTSSLGTHELLCRVMLRVVEQVELLTEGVYGNGDEDYEGV